MSDQIIWVAWQEVADEPQIIGLATSELAARRIAMAEIPVHPRISRITLNAGSLYGQIVANEVGAEPPVAAPRKRAPRKPKPVEVPAAVIPLPPRAAQPETALAAPSSPHPGTTPDFSLTNPWEA